ncbi:hypothetical protein FORC066_2904 [Yersinia enterocolitica]|nr:hypothetical protein FORC066_2904 [Yersinia enterocolitica]
MGLTFYQPHSLINESIDVILILPENRNIEIFGTFSCIYHVM